MTPSNPHVSRAYASIGLLVAGALCSFALSACGSSQSTTQRSPVLNIEAQFQPMVDAFTTEAQAQGTLITINDLIVQSVQDLPNTEEMGVCLQEAGSPPVIQISQPLWDSLDPVGQQLLIFHELGHCVLNRAHETTLNNGVPTTVMNPIFLGSALYDANKAQYLHELFTGQNISSTLNMVIPNNVFLPNFSLADASLSD